MLTTQTACRHTPKAQGSNPFATVEKMTLPNGLEVLFYPNPASPVVCVHFWCRTGSRNEPQEWAGISHFFEHMFFKGSKNYGVGAMDRLIKSLGGYNNAFTSIEYTGYYVVLPAGNFTKAMDVLLDAIRFPAFDPKEINLEREVVREEINRKHDNPTGTQYEVFQNLIFQGSVYAPPVLGTAESVGRIDHDAFVTYLKSFYHPKNLCMIIAGDFDRAEVLAYIRQATDGWVGEAHPVLQEIPVKLLERDRPVEKVIEKETQQSYGVTGYRYPGYAQPATHMALDVASSMLAGGRSSRLYRRLYVQDNLVQSVSAWVWPQAEAGAFGINVVCPPANLERVRSIINEELQLFIREPWDPEELNKVKTKLIADFEMGTETANDVAQALGEAWVYGRVPTLVSYVTDVEALNEVQIKAALRETLKPAGEVYVTVQPPSSEPKE